VYARAGRSARPLGGHPGRRDARRAAGGSGTPLFIASAGQVTGLLPFSRLTKYKGTIVSRCRHAGAAAAPGFFPEMLQRIPVLGQRLVAWMSDRIRETSGRRPSATN